VPAVGVYGRFMLNMIKRAEAVPVMHNLLVPLDRTLFKATKGRASLAHFGAGKSQVMQNLLLTTVGRKSGKRRDSPVLFLDHEGGYVVVGSRYGSEQHPGWTYNLLADPHASVIVRGREQRVTARRLSEDELEALWPQLLRIYPAWQDYRERTNREFRAFLLTPSGV
jgi:deazaflavin-dependent oxidoreductase (nitroreductase family)